MSLSRTSQLLGVLLIALTVVLGAAPTAVAENPMRLPAQIVDRAGVLSASGETEVQRAIDELYDAQRIRLWVVFVDDFSGRTADGWARATANLSELGDQDALLAVSPSARSYAFLVSSHISGVSASRVEAVRRDDIEPALRRGDWTGAAAAAATGLTRATTPAEFDMVPMVLALTGIGLAGLILFAVTRYLRHRRRGRIIASARKVDPTDSKALAALPVFALDDLSRVKVVEVDNAVRTSANELELAIDEFGAERTTPFSDAVEQAKAALAKAFTVRQQLDDDIPETPTQQRDLLTGLIIEAANADRDLEAQRDAFEKLRDLVINAPDRLDGLTRQLVELTSRIPVADQHLSELRTEFDDAALASVSGNVKTARDRTAFAERNITRARQLVDKPVTGGQSDLVDAFRAAESALGQCGRLLDAVDNAAHDIRHAVATLPEAVTDTEAGIAAANKQLQSGGGGSHRSELRAAHDAAVQAVRAARGSSDPLGAFTALTEADAELDRLLDTVAEEQAALERATRALDQAVFTAASRIRAVSDYIDTRRGSVGPEARTRLAEARRRLGLAQDRSADTSAALTEAEAAGRLAAQAQHLAKSDVQAAQQEYYARHGTGGGDGSAMLGGIIIGNILGGGGFGGGFGSGGSGGGGGWSPTSFGGSGGGFFGGGGRF